MNNSTLPKKLKSLTLANHQQLEKVLMQKIRIVKEPQQYLEILYWFYGYFGRLETLLSKYITPHHLKDYNQRRKSDSLINDINYLKGDLPNLAGSADLPQITNHLQAFGALYVMEGSTLGGIIISQIMQKQLNLPGPSGFSFFNGYGSETQTMWEDFKNALSKQPFGDEDAQTIIDAANETFLMFKHWIESN